MLELYFKAADDLRQKWGGPLIPRLDEVASILHSRGYCWDQGRRALRIAGHFSHFLMDSGVNDQAQIDRNLIDTFLDGLGHAGSFRYAGSDLRHLLDHLRASGVIPTPEKPRRDDPFSALLCRFDDHLRDIRGNTALTRAGYLLGARRFLHWLAERYGDRPLAMLNGRDVLEFVAAHADLFPGGSWPNQLCTTTRQFLRFLQWEGIVSAGLDRMVPRVPGWRLCTLPRCLTWEQTRALIGSVDPRTPKGLRDKAVLLLLADLGLRNEEVRSLRIRDVAWRAGEIRLPEAKTRRERVMPLTQEAGAALADYLLRGRPPLDVPQVFLRHRSPKGPLDSSTGVSNIVRRYLEVAGIDAPAHGAYLLRHTLATRMVNQQVPIKDIADVLGHTSIDTTAIYSKVDVAGLAAVALPFPGGVR
jgi:site-specific recombinase XerD